MGANMVRRLLKAGHECAVFDMSHKAMEELVQEKAMGASSLGELAKKLTKPRLSAAEGAPEEIRIRAGQGRGGGKGSPRDRPGGSAALAPRPCDDVHTVVRDSRRTERAKSRLLKIDTCRKGCLALSLSLGPQIGRLLRITFKDADLPGARLILFCATLPASTQTIYLYSSSPKSDICLALSAHGFQTTVEAEPIFSTRILRWRRES
jgi:hypothetical protein